MINVHINTISAAAIESINPISVIRNVIRINLLPIKRHDEISAVADKVAETSVSTTDGNDRAVRELAAIARISAIVPRIMPSADKTAKIILTKIFIHKLYNKSTA